ncbi:MAG: MerR family transcriptional regulator [Flavobacteriales bacterium]|jgi:DNA-binding transcriptional MerR regulator|nr:MerR family transcriptional regulator [Flavobacteriales bacterium]|tara:strand:+ start:3291 stop:3623 length:333 start_codon:yes stop_codon:yes gene_type:complete
MNLDNQKIYYSISEVGDLLDVSTSLIRFWEKEFDIIKPKKNSRGNRIFTKNDIKNIALIFHLLKEKKYTIKGAKKKIRENKEGVNRNFEIINNLKSIRDQLSQIRDELKK